MLKWLQVGVLVLVGAAVLGVSAAVVLTSGNAWLALLPPMATYASVLSLLLWRDRQEWVRRTAAFVFQRCLSTTARATGTLTVVLLVCAFEGTVLYRLWAATRQYLIVEIREGPTPYEGAFLELRDLVKDTSSSLPTDARGLARFPAYSSIWQVVLTIKREDVLATTNLESEAIREFPHIKHVQLANIDNDAWQATKLGTASTLTRVQIATSFSQQEAGFSAEQIFAIESNCFAGLPEEGRDETRRIAIAAHSGFVVGYSLAERLPLWVCEHVERAQLLGDVRRALDFRPDPLVPITQQASNQDYVGSGYDRGHLASLGNEQREEDWQSERNFFTNIAPQVPDLNRGLWSELEQEIREWVHERGEVYLMSGGLLYDPAEDDPSTADGLVDYKAIGPSSVVVPTHFFKIVVRPRVAGEWEMVGFVASNNPYQRPFDLSALIKSVDWIEERAGFDFFPELDTLTSERLEATDGRP